MVATNGRNVVVTHVPNNAVVFFAVYQIAQTDEPVAVALFSVPQDSL